MGFGGYGGYGASLSSPRKSEEDSEKKAKVEEEITWQPEKDYMDIIVSK